MDDPSEWMLNQQSPIVKRHTSFQVCWRIDRRRIDHPMVAMFPPRCTVFPSVGCRWRGTRAGVRAEDAPGACIVGTDKGSLVSGTDRAALAARDASEWTATCPRRRLRRRGKPALLESGRHRPSCLLRGGHPETFGHPMPRWWSRVCPDPARGAGGWSSGRLCYRSCDHIIVTRKASAMLFRRGNATASGPTAVRRPRLSARNHVRHRIEDVHMPVLAVEQRDTMSTFPGRQSLWWPTNSCPQFGRPRRRWRPESRHPRTPRSASSARRTSSARGSDRAGLPARPSCVVASPSRQTPLQGAPSEGQGALSHSTARYPCLDCSKKRGSSARGPATWGCRPR
jgi:hypothetical protein